ncbi:YHYH domain-containing protein [Aliivibrio fischeri]|nr:MULTISPECIES: YHYH domain-containing protein [Aliivibrio]MUK32119.1 YHYH domain-containing protein [Aliivibrio fischeri]MUK39837.1 YHYH domain-containing protein [Aliivibrio fischeri]MUL07577.1 YHYH domain-containing protein [Aliivibrio fischeri]
MKKLVLIMLVCFGLPSGAIAHSGGTDSNGCHTNHKTGEYHCHNRK